MSEVSQGELESTSGKKVVIVLLVIVLGVSSVAAFYGLYLRPNEPHSVDDHLVEETEEETPPEAERSDVEDHMRDIGYVQ